MDPTRSHVVTLFEGHYVLGAGALANSMSAWGFTGTLWMGIRGPVPGWLSQCQADGQDAWKLGPMRLRLLHLDDVKIHFTNFKPQMLIRLLDELAPTAERVFYIDPDIVINKPWTYFDEWASDAVALCSDVNVQCPPGHPLRRQWRRFYEPHGWKYTCRQPVYVNGGFIGLPRAERQILEQWRQAQDLMAPLVGGLGTAFPGDRTNPFHMTDQDALNAVLDATEAPLAVAGQDGMAFTTGGVVMAHALGQPKPWRKKYLVHALDARPPSLADRIFWKHVEKPLRLYPPLALALHRLDLRLGNFIGRFYKRP